MNNRLTVDTINDEQLDALYRERDTLRASVLDIDAHATPIGLADPNDPDGTPHHYVVTVGALHRALGKVGHTAASCTAEAERDGAYRERAHLVALLAALYPSHIGYTDPAAIDWLVVTIETPTGQMSWHIAERDRDLFEHVQLVVSTHNVWDGHTTEEKYKRLRELTRITPGPMWAPEPARLGQYPDVRRERAEADMLAANTAEAVRQMDADPTQPHTGLVIQPYRERGVEKWVFRCWGSDTCDGVVSLDHTSQRWAEQARDRHVTEEH